MSSLYSWFKGLPAGAQFGMGETISSLFGSMMGSSALESFYSNLQDPLGQMRDVQRANIDREVGLQNKQADLALSEATADAEAKAVEVAKFRGEQALKYSSAGVLLTGSPMDVLEETRRLGAQEIQRIMARGAAQSSLLRSRANITQSEGLAGLLGQEMAFNTQRASARAQASQSKSLPLLYALSGIGNLFRGKQYYSPYGKPQYGSANIPVGGSTLTPFSASSFAIGDNF